MDKRLYSGFLASARSMPDRPALHVDGESLSYGSLLRKAKRIAATLQRRLPVAGAELVGVLADRSASGFSGMLGALLAGRGYVPLNPHFPIARTQRMLQRAGCRAVVVDATGLRQLEELLAAVSEPLLILVPHRDEVHSFIAAWPQHHFVTRAELEYEWSWDEPQPAAADVAYLLFTSGSTGEPKGVPVTHANAVSFVTTAVDRYGITSTDRLSQTFDATFDLHVFDLFVAWERGACVYCPPRELLLNPDWFIREHRLTVWFSVPSLGVVMQRIGALKPGRYPSLRWSLFCGEPLPVSLATAWAAAAPESILENLYGPTELTVACAAYRWDTANSAGEARDGIVPIGQPFDSMRARVVDEDLQEVAAGEVGELLMTGPQRTAGYWQDEDATNRAHVRLPDSDELFYRTGDRVRRPIGDGPMTYVGRIDHQVKIFGHRVELGEIESALRQEPGIEAAVAVAWPMTTAGPGGVVAFVVGRDIDPAAVRSHLGQKLQAYAVPQAIEVLPEFPYNASGKVDRHALVRRLSA